MSNEFKAICESFNLKYDENANHCLKSARPCKRRARRRMASKFQFKPPSSASTSRSAASKPTLNVKSCPSIHPKPEPEPPKEDDALWMDDIDEDMLVAASQMVENEMSKTGGQERMEMDADALHMFIREEETKNDDWTSKATSHRFDQTSTVLEGERKRSDATKSTNCIGGAIRPDTNTTTKPKDDEIQRIMNEHRSLTQKCQAKAGEISFLRNELARRQKEIELNRQERQKILDEKAQEKKNFEAEKKAIQLTFQSEKEFMQRELDQAAEAILRTAKTLPNGDAAANRRKMHESSKTTCVGPPPKRPRQNIPSTIDESFFAEDVDKIGSSRAIADAQIQTLPNPRRSYVVSSVGSNYQGDKGSLASLMNFGDRNNFLESLHCASRLSVLAKSMRHLTAGLKQPHEVDEKLTIRELSNARVFVDHLPLAMKSDVGLAHDLRGTLHDVLSILTAKALDGKGSVIDAALALISAIIQNESLRTALDPQFLVTFSNEVVRKLQDRENAIEIFVGLLTFLTEEPELVEGQTCRNSNDACLMFSIWSFINQLKFESMSPHSKALLADIVLKWVSTNLSRKRLHGSDSSGEAGRDCDWCRSDLIKVLSTISWSLVDHMINLEAKGIPDDQFCLLAKASLVCLFQVSNTDPDDFVRGLVESPAVQRRYIWTTRQLSRIKGYLKLTAEQELILQDLKVDVTHS